jgi:K+-sensing histidine kinase KdpD
MLAANRDESERLGRLVGTCWSSRGSTPCAPSPNATGCRSRRSSDRRCRARASLAGRAVTSTFPEEVVEAHVDPVLVEQALVDLLENAARHTPAGNAVDVAARRVGDDAVFEVFDRGPGVPADEGERVFERFYRGGDARRGEGAGLGLAVVQAIACVHGGAARVHAREGGGSVFSLAITGVRVAREPS